MLNVVFRSEVIYLHPVQKNELTVWSEDERMAGRGGVGRGGRGGGGL